MKRTECPVSEDGFSVEVIRPIVQIMAEQSAQVLLFGDVSRLTCFKARTSE